MVNSILIASGKGGTGKTVVGINVANGLKDQGYTVSLLDLDLDSPNISEFLKISADEVLDKSSGKIRFKPIDVDGIKVFTMGAIIGDLPVSMRGANYTRIIKDVIISGDYNTEYYVCDLPSGISDEFKEVVKLLADGLLGTIIVVQPMNEGDARRVLELHKMEGLPVLGLIENMSYFKCENCGEKYEVFGNGTSEALSKEYGVPFLGSIPLSMSIKEGIEVGKPFLKGYDKRTVNNAVKQIMETKPIETTLIERIRTGIKKISVNVLLDLMAISVTIVNETINLDSILSKHGFPGGRTIELNITDKDLQRVKSKNCFRVEGGYMKYVPNPTVLDLQIYIWDQAFIWSCLGYMKRGDEAIRYSWKHALLTNKVEVYGAPTQEILEFMDELWMEVPNQLQQRKKFWGVLSKFA